MDLSVQNLYGLLLRSRLLPPEDARRMYERWQAEAKGKAGDVGEFAKWMVANQFVTEYQAALLARGHADSFFLDQYKVLERLGRGRMAGVYKAVHALGQTVAIKVLPPSRAKDLRILGRFRREARMALQLKHSNVVRTYQIGEANGLHYLVMEHLEGETLADVLARRGKLPPAEAVRLMHQALIGLQYIHEQGLVHRDLKPSNLMLVPSRVAGQPDTTLQSTVKILDIGLARPMTRSNASDGTRSMVLTSEGTLLGTPDYMAPEQAQNARAADIRADIYSLGAVLYHLLTGQPPFPDTNIVNQMIRHDTEPPRPLRELNAAVPDGLQQIVNWMLAKDPAQRYATPGRAAQALQVFLVAGNELTSSESDARLSSYLTWLETASNGEKQEETTPSAPPAEAARRARKHKRQRPKTAMSLPAQPSPSPNRDFDVELVAMPPVAQPRRTVSRRDFLAFVMGAGSILLAIFIGWLLALVLRKG
jgi:serine/threonine protein kinase